MKNNTGKERSSDEMSERVMKPEKFLMQRSVASLCTKGNLLWMEQQAQRFRGYAILPGRWNGLGGEAMGLLMYSALTIMECNFKNMHLFKQRQMESHTHSHTKAFTQYGDVHKGENTQCSRAMCVYVHVQKLWTPKASTVMFKHSTIHRVLIYVYSTISQQKPSHDT